MTYQPKPPYGKKGKLLEETPTPKTEEPKKSYINTEGENYETNTEEDPDSDW